jgi:hypothetical protein
MPSWKKVIISGSNAALNSLTVTNGITGSLFGTASFATTAATASNSQNAQDILIYVKNTSGAQINKGKVVRISGATGDNALIATASYESDGLSANTLGITNQDIPNDSFGYVMTEGTLIGINTDTFSAGQLLYLGATGSIIGTAPVAPLHAVRLGQVLRVQTNNGSMYVRIDNGYELGELHDVVDTTTTSSFGDLLVKSGSVWINSKQLTGSYGLTGSLDLIYYTPSSNGISVTGHFPRLTLINSGSGATASGGSITVRDDNFATKTSGQTILSLSATNAGSSVVGRIFFTKASSTSTNINFNNSGGSAVMFISGSGDVGIGTTTPGAKLDVSGSAIISGSFTVIPGTIREFQVRTTGVDIGNLITDTHTVTGSLNISGSITGSLFGTASVAATSVITTQDTTPITYNVVFTGGTSGNQSLNVDQTTLTYNPSTTTLAVTNLAGTASNALQATTASFVNTLNQNVLITGSATIGSTTAGASENTLTLGARDTANEGGQLGLNAPGGTYTSASFIDNWQNQVRILRGNNITSDATVATWNLHTKQMQLPQYTNASAFVGTATANLAVDSGGNIITVSTSGAPVFPYVGNAVITGSLTTTGIIYAEPNGGMYFRGGDDAALYDVNIVNTMGIYGIQDITVGAIKLGSNGPVLYGSGSSLGIGTTQPLYPLHVSASASGTSIYATGDIVAFSDQSVKENIRPIENVIERIGDSRGVLYDRIDNSEKDNIGFIAQELEVAFPELVVTNPDGTKAVKYQNAVAVLFEAIKEQQKQINGILKLLNK